VDRNTGELVAVKIIDKKRHILNSKVIAAFEREVSLLQRSCPHYLSFCLYYQVEILRSLDHKNIVQFRDCFEIDHCIYLVQELVPLGDLLKYVNERERLSEEEAKYLFKQMIEVLKVFIATFSLRKSLTRLFQVFE
jgi:serine/threonine protein kinase